jgi:hypothetical protein
MNKNKKYYPDLFKNYEKENGLKDKDLITYNNSLNYISNMIKPCFLSNMVTVFTKNKCLAKALGADRIIERRIQFHWSQSKGLTVLNKNEELFKIDLSSRWLILTNKGGYQLTFNILIRDLKVHYNTGSYASITLTLKWGDKDNNGNIIKKGPWEDPKFIHELVDKIEEKLKDRRIKLEEKRPIRKGIGQLRKIK